MAFKLWNNMCRSRYLVKLGPNYVSALEKCIAGHTGNNGWMVMPQTWHFAWIPFVWKNLPYQTYSCFWWQLSGLLNINVVFWRHKGQQSFVDESGLLHSKWLGCHVKNCNRSIFCIQISKNKLFPKSLIFWTCVVFTWKTWKASSHVCFFGWYILKFLTSLHVLMLNEIWRSQGAVTQYQ